MTKISLTIISLVFSALIFKTKAQSSVDTIPFKVQADFKLQNLNKSYITTGILYDRIFPIANLDLRKGNTTNNTDTSHPDHFMQSYFELYNSSYNTTGWDSPQSLDYYLDTSQMDAHPIGVLLYSFNVLDTNAIQDHLIDTLSNGQFVDVAGRPRSPYFTNTTFVASPVIGENQIISEGDNVFYFDPKFFLQNQGFHVSEVRVDFGDGQGDWVVTNPFDNYSGLRTGSLSNYIVKSLGISTVGSIVVTGIDLLGHLIQYGNPFKIFAKSKKQPSGLTSCKGLGQKWVIDSDPNALNSINNIYHNPILDYTKQVSFACPVSAPPGMKCKKTINVKDSAYFFFSSSGTSCGATIRRPILFIDGIDPTNTRGVEEIYRDYINKRVLRNGQFVLFGDYMLGAGYDFIVLDYKHGNDLLERNALTLVALIQRLNQTYAASYLQDITIVGPSMGSLIAQYALSYMEHNNIPHHIKTYVSFDGCHEGANIPIGLQDFVEYVSKKGILKKMKIIREGFYNGLAARQMLAHHQSANSQAPAVDALRTQFLSNLAAVGEYPILCRKVAIINGSYSKLNPYHQVNENLLSLSLQRTGFKSIWGLCNANICNKFNWICRTTTNAGTNKVAEMWTLSPLFNLLFAVPPGYTNYLASAASNNSALDNAPGGLIGEKISDTTSSDLSFLVKEGLYLLTGGKGSMNININNFTIMPSYSSADLRFPTMTDNSAKNFYMDWSHSYLCGHTPFDFVYSQKDTNTEHVTITQSISQYFESEVSCAKTDLPVFFDPNIAGATEVCNNPENYSINFCTPSNHTTIWTLSNPRLVTMNINGDQMTLTPRNGSSGPLTITATVTFPCSTLPPFVTTKNINVGAIASSIVGPYDPVQRTVMGIACIGKQYYFVSDSDPNSTYDWTLFPPQGSTQYPTLYSGSTVYINDFTEIGAYTLQVSKSNICGTIVSSITVNSDQCYSGFSMIASPNPANTVMNVKIVDRADDSKNLSKDEDITIELYEFNSGFKQKQWKFKNTQNDFSINVSGIPKGYYLIRVKKGKYMESKQIMINFDH